MLSSLPRLLGKRVRQDEVEVEVEEEVQEVQTQIMSSFTTISRRPETWTTGWTSTSRLRWWRRPTTSL